MSKQFRNGDLNQAYLLPPSLQDWLPEGHLARFVAEVVEALDLAGIYAKQGSADSRISESLRLSPCHNPQFWALVAVAAYSQKVDVYHVKNRRL
jgi:hypothetical protein